MREHRSEWADNSIDAYSAAAVKVGPCSLPGSRVGSFSGQVILPLAHTIEHEELLEVIKLEGVGHCPEDAIMPRDMFLLQPKVLLLSMPLLLMMHLFCLLVFASFLSILARSASRITL
ncbi:unnamed protein product [Camellia sinensis]